MCPKSHQQVVADFGLELLIPNSVLSIYFLIQCIHPTCFPGAGASCLRSKVQSAQSSDHQAFITVVNLGWEEGSREQEVSDPPIRTFQDERTRCYQLGAILPANLGVSPYTCSSSRRWPNYIICSAPGTVLSH